MNPYLTSYKLHYDWPRTPYLPYRYDFETPEAVDAYLTENQHPYLSSSIQNHRGGGGVCTCTLNHVPLCRQIQHFVKSYRGRPRSFIETYLTYPNKDCDGCNLQLKEKFVPKSHYLTVYKRDISNIGPKLIELATKRVFKCDSNFSKRKPKRD